MYRKGTVCRMKKPVRGGFPQLLHLEPQQIKRPSTELCTDSAWTGLVLSSPLQVQEFWEAAGLSLGAPVTPGFSLSQSQILAQPKASWAGLLWKGRRPSVSRPPSLPLFPSTIQPSGLLRPPSGSPIFFSLPHYALPTPTCPKPVPTISLPHAPFPAPVP